MDGSSYRSDPWWVRVPATVPEMAEALGLACNGKSCSCPACGAERRGSSDRRLAVLLTPDRRGWRCPRCDGTGPRFVRVGTGRRSRAAYRLAELEAWLEARSFASTAEEVAP